MVDITIVNGAYKPTYNYGAPHCRSISASDISPISREEQHIGMGPNPRKNEQHSLQKGPALLS